MGDPDARCPMGGEHEFDEETGECKECGVTNRVTFSPDSVYDKSGIRIPSSSQPARIDLGNHKPSQKKNMKLSPKKKTKSKIERLREEGNEITTNDLAKIDAMHLRKDTKEHLEINRRVNDFLGTKNMGKISPQISDLFSSSNIQDEISNIIKIPGVPSRSLISPNGETITPPSRERTGLEVYCHYSKNEAGFWFFQDYIRRLKLNGDKLDYVISKSIPISIQVCVTIQKKIEEDRIGRRFLERCNEKYLPNGENVALDYDTIEKMNIDWNGLELSSKSKPEINRLHYWKTDEEDSEKGSSIQLNTPLLLYHLPVAYYFAQECANRKLKNWRHICAELSRHIQEDLYWCGSSFKEMNKWWEDYCGREYNQFRPVTQYNKWDE